MNAIGRPAPQQAVLELQARARDHALADRLDRLERSLARVHAAIDGAMVTMPPGSATTREREEPARRSR